MTSKCSIVPRSRSRITAAPDRIRDSIVMFDTICITDMNQLESRFGLNAVRIVTVTGGPSVSPDRFRNSES